MPSSPGAVSPQKVSVVGGGIIGVLTAVELQDRGHDVTLIEPEMPGGRQAASYGNGTWTNEGSIIPISLPGLWRKVPGYLLNPDGPFVIRWRYLPKLMPWLVRFMLAGRSWARVERDLPARYALVKDTVEHYEIRARQAGIEHLLGERSVIYLYRSEDEFRAEERAWSLRAAYGIETRLLGRPDLQRLLPDISADYLLGAQILQARSLRDPGAYCEGLAQWFVKRGGRLLTAKATGFSIENSLLRGVQTDKGLIECTRAVLAAGVQSGPLARQLGDPVPMIAERGYHITLRDLPLPPGISVMPADGKMAVAATTTGLRLAGQVELTAAHAPPIWARSKIQLKAAKRLYPQLAEAIENAPHDMWYGNRPSTPDGLPIIAPSRACAQVVHAFGHGHTGMAMAPATARLAADLVEGVPPSIDPKPYSPRRFRFVA